MQEQPPQPQTFNQPPAVNPLPVPTGVGGGAPGQQLGGQPAYQPGSFGPNFQQSQIPNQAAQGLQPNPPFNSTYPSWSPGGQVGQQSGLGQSQTTPLNVNGQPSPMNSVQQPLNPNSASQQVPFGQSASPSQPPPVMTSTMAPISPTKDPQINPQNPPASPSPQKLGMEPEASSNIVKDAVNYLSNNIYEETIDGVTYKYFMAEKENNIGIKYNLRFFLISDNELAYATQFDAKTLEIPFRSLAKVPVIKKRFRWEDITLENPKKQTIKLVIQLNPKDKATWLLRAKNADANLMLQMYTVMFEAQNNKKQRMQQPPLSPTKVGEPSQMNQSKPLGQQNEPQSPVKVGNAGIVAPPSGNPYQPIPTPVAVGGQPQQNGLQTIGQSVTNTGSPQKAGQTNSQIGGFNQGSNQLGQTNVGYPNQPAPNQFGQPGQPNQLPQSNQPGQPWQPVPQTAQVGQSQYGRQTGQPQYGPQVGQSQFGLPSQAPPQQVDTLLTSTLPNQSLIANQSNQVQFPVKDGQPIQPNAIGQQGQWNQPNQYQQQNQFGQTGQTGQPSQPNNIPNANPPTRQQYQPSNINTGYQGQSNGQPPYQSNSGIYQSGAYGILPPQQPSETELLRENFKKLDEQNRSNNRSLLPAAAPILQPNAALSQYYQDFLRLFNGDRDERKKILYTDNQNWNYQLLKGDEENVTLSFKTFAEALVADIIDDLNEKQSNYRPSEDLSDTESTITFKDYQGVEVRLCFTALKDYKLLKETKESVLNEAAIKAAFREFENMNYLMQLTRNKGRIRVPLAAVVEYKGIVGFVRANISADPSKAPKSLLQELELIARESRIRESIFEDERAVTIAPLQSKLYEKLAREENNPLVRQSGAFDLYYLEQVRHFLPADLQFAAKDPENYILRSEFIQRPEFADVWFLGENLKKYLGKQKVPKEVQEDIRQLDDNEKYVVRIVDELVKDLEETDEMLGSSFDIAYLMHKRGLNMRYLGLVYSTAKASFIRKICMAEVAARCAKSVLQYDLQNIVRNARMSRKNGLSDAATTTDSMLDYAIGFLNSVTGVTSDSGEVWSRMNKQALYEFNISLAKQEIAEGHFVQALLHHCNVRCGFRYQLGDKLFLRNIFERNRESNFTVRSRVYSLKYTDLYRRVQAILDNPTEDSFEQLKSLLNLRKFDLPKHMKLDGTYEWLAVFLATMVPPRVKEGTNDALPCSSLYQVGRRDIPNLAGFHIALTEIKWDLQADRVEDALYKKDQLERRIIRWFGDVHPSLSELYSVFATYFLNKCRFDEASNYARSSLVNNSSLLGNNSLKTAESHYDLANIFLKASRREEALNYYRKAKNIFDNKNATERLSYAEIEIRIAALDLQFDRFEEAEALALSAVSIFEIMEDETQMVNAYQLISRIYEITKRRDKLERTAEYCGHLLADVQHQSNLETLIKIVLLPMLTSLPSVLAAKFAQFVQSIPYTYNNSNQTNALNFIKGFIKEGVLVNKLRTYINSLEETLQAINNNGLLARWRGLGTEIRTDGQEFIAIIESLVYLLGEGFLAGALGEQ